MSNHSIIMKTTISLVIVAILVIGGVVIFSEKKAPEQIMEPAPQAASGLSTTTVPAVASSYTLAQVAVHASASSCWSVIDGAVYDLTPWIRQHPGGERAILGICGIDGSAAFNGQHGGQSRPAAALVNFKIGALTR